MPYSKAEKQLIALSFLPGVLRLLSQTAGAMHIMEGYLPAGHAAAWGVVSLPFVVAGVIRIQKIVQRQKRLLMLLAMSGAFIFVISSLKIPSVTGSCSHMTGTGLAAILFGPAATSVLGLIVLLFQALLLAHGGLTTLGANTFSMAIAGPLVSWGIYLAGTGLKCSRKLTVFLAAALGDLLTYCVTSFQLAAAYPSEAGGILASAVKFLGVFAFTQLPLAVIEGILTVLIVMGLEGLAQPELKEIALWEGR